MLESSHSLCMETSDDNSNLRNTDLDTWSGFEAAKTAPWPSQGLHHFGKFF